MSDEQPTLLLIDGHSMAFRAFYALPAENFVTSTGQVTNAVYGFTSMLINQLNAERPTHMAVAFDLSRTTFRTQMYPEYKGTREQTPEEFKGQISLIKDVLDAMGICWLEKEDFEADDIIATLSTQGSESGMRVLVCSGDRDSFQLINDNVTVLYPKRGVSELNIMTPASVEEKYGVTPQGYPDMAALVGEVSDNLPGVPGVGTKTAAKWLVKYGNLDGIVENVAEIGGKVGDSLRAHLDQVLLNRRLGELRRDLKLSRSVRELTVSGLDREAVHRVFDSLEFRTLRDRLLASAYVVDGQKDPENEQFFPGPEIEDLAEGKLSDWLEAAASMPAGIEVLGEWQKGQGDAWKIAIARPNATAIVLDLLSLADADASALESWLASSDHPKALHESKAAAHMLSGRGLVVKGVTFDSSLAAYLCYPDQRTYDLDDLSIRLLGRYIHSAEPDSGQGLLQLDDSEQVRLAARASAVAALVDPLTTELKSRHAQELFDNLEMPLVPVLAQMESAGIAIDQRVLDDLGSELESRAEAAAAGAFEALGGQEINLSSPKQLQEALFFELQMPKTRKIKTGYSTDAEALAELYARTQHPFLEHLIAYRDVIKLHQMIESLSKAIGEDNRIHTTYQQASAATGRLASSDPNLQNIPIRTDTGRRIRGAFVVGDGYETLVTADYSQIEMRIMAHLSKDQGLIDAFNSGEDLHSFVASRVFDVAPRDVTPAMRSKIKAMSYGLVYGLSSYGLARQLGISNDEAKGLMDDYFERFGGIRDYLDQVVEEARRTGYTETIMGRRRYLPDLNSDRPQRRRMAERMALNAPIQGSAADIIKVAMLGVATQLEKNTLRSRMLLQVHDELIIETAAGEAEEVEQILREQMGSAAKLAVPLSVSVGRGDTWENAGH